MVSSTATEKLDWRRDSMSEKNSNGYTTKKKEEKKMAVSMAVVPTLKGKAADSVLKTLSSSKIKPYSPESRVDTEKKISDILQRRNIK